MASKESTVVNALIDLARSRPLQGPLDTDDLLFDQRPRGPVTGNPFASRDPFAAPTPMSRHRAPAGTNLELTAPVPKAPIMPVAPTLPLMPQAVRASSAVAIPPPRPGAQLPELPSWADDELARTNQVISKMAPADLLDDDDAVRDVAGRPEVTMKTRVPQRVSPGKVVVPAAIAGCLGVMVGGYLIFNGSRRGPAPTSHPAAPRAAAAGAMPGDERKAAPAVAAPVATPAAAPVAAPAALEAPAPIVEPAAGVVAAMAPASEVSLTFTTEPAGATVMLVDRGQALILGTTPIARPVTANRDYDVVFTFNGLPTKVVHFHAGDAPDITAELRGEPMPVAAAKPAAAVVVAVAVRHRASRPVTIAAAKRAPTELPATKTASGVLMIASKPPCEIWVDGKKTGLMTPQRSVAMPSGPHQITLVSPQYKIKKSVSVTIAAGKPTKVVQDYTKLMKK